VRLVREHRSEYPSLTAASAAVARQIGVGHESVRRWVLQADIDDGTRDGVTSVDHAEIKRLKAENTRLREDVAILRAATSFFVGVLSCTRSTSETVDDGFHRHDEIRGTRGLVDLPGPARAGLPDRRAHVPRLEARCCRGSDGHRRARGRRGPRGRVAAWTTVELVGRQVRKLTPEGLYGRRKMTALIRRTTIPAKDGIRAGDLLNKDFTAPRPDHTWVMDFTYCRTWPRWVYVAFIVDVYSQRIVGWHAQTSKHVELVMIPLRMSLWERGRQGHPIQPQQLRAHSDAGSQYVSLAYTDKLALDGIAPSIGSVGDAYHNALMESINGLYTAECFRTTVFHDGPFKTIADVEYATAGWVDWFNNRRLYSSLGYVPPAEFEQAHYATLNRDPRPA
jgi:putative transposase